MTSYAGFTISMSATTLDAAAELNISSIFSTGAKIAGFALTFDSILHSNRYDVKKLKSGFQYVIREGTGIRIALAVKTLSTNIGFSFGAVLAETKLGLASTVYKIEGIGLDTSVLQSLFKIDESGELDENSYLAITETLTIDFPNYIDPQKTAAHDTKPVWFQAYTTPLTSISVSPREQARMINYAMSAAARGTPLALAIKEKPAWVGEGALGFAYSMIAEGQLVKPNESLPRQMTDRASRWLKEGNFE